MHPGINLDSTPLMRKSIAELLNNCTFSHIEYVNFPAQEVSPLPRFPRCLFAFFVYPHIFPAIRPFSTDDVRFSAQRMLPLLHADGFRPPVPRPPSMRFLMIFSGRRSPPTRSIFIFHCPIRKTTALQRLRSRSAVSRKKHLPHPGHLWRTRSRLWQNTTAMPFRPPVSSPMTSCRIILRRSSPHPI